MILSGKHLVQTALVAIAFLEPALARAQAPPAADAWVLAGDHSNHGDSRRLNVQMGGGRDRNENQSQSQTRNADTDWNRNQHTYIRFDLTKFPADLTVANIQKASLTLFANSVERGGTFWVCKVETQTTAWTEGSINGNNAPPCDPAFSNLIPVAVAPANQGDYLVVDITPIVASWFPNPSANNNGIALLSVCPSGFACADPSTSNLNVSFDSKENTDTSHDPRLDIILTATGATGAQGPTGPVGPVGPSGPAGPAGPQGLQGASGAPGPIGATGPAGPQGMPGPAGLIGPQGVMGLQGPAGPTGPAGSGGGGFNGIQEFTQSGTFTDPTGITRLFVELWGGGGGGGQSGSIGSFTAGAGQTIFCMAAGAGSGGAGGYTRAIISVSSGTVYNVTIGAAGAQGGLPGGGTNGGPGGDTFVADSSGNVAVKAGGGQGGTLGQDGFPVVVGGLVQVCNTPTAGTGGAGGVGGTGLNVVSRNGGSGIAGSAAANGMSGANGATIPPPAGSIGLLGNANGGTGSAAGGSGYALLTW
jgi:hypothetical protein